MTTGFKAIQLGTVIYFVPFFFVLDPALDRTAPAPRRPFQGWRYLRPEDEPYDLPSARVGDDVLPPELAEALAEFGLR